MTYNEAINVIRALQTCATSDVDKAVQLAVDALKDKADPKRCEYCDFFETGYTDGDGVEQETWCRDLEIPVEPDFGCVDSK